MYNQELEKEKSSVLFWLKMCHFSTYISAGAGVLLLIVFVAVTSNSNIERLVIELLR